MITVRFAKSKLENQEGMNHLWVHLEPIGHVENARIQIILPPGILRRRNLNHFHEDDSGEILIYQPNIPDDIFIEIFTREPVSCGEKTLVFALSYNDKNGIFNRVDHFVSVEIADEDDMDNVIIDEEVVNKIKDLRQYDDERTNKELDSTFKIIRINPDPNSDLEKKYRIEG